jgi:hypothetical protein
MPITSVQQCLQGEGTCTKSRGSSRWHVGILAGKSYRQADWLPSQEVWADKGQLLRNFMYRRDRGLEDDEYGELQNGIHPDWLLVERVIAQRGGPKNKEFLVKWCGQSYSETTWEPEAQLSNDQVYTPEFVNEAQRPGMIDHRAVLFIPHASYTIHSDWIPMCMARQHVSPITGNRQKTS